MDKAELRQKHRRIRLSMAAEEVANKSKLVCQNLMDYVDLSNVSSINTYVPNSILNEVDCSYFIDLVHRLHPEIKIVYTGQEKTSAPPSQKFDLVIVPTLAFDKDDNRIGWGGGWYDNFLSAQPEAVKIGLCFQASFEAGGIKAESHDIQLDKVITEV